MRVKNSLAVIGACVATVFASAVSVGVGSAQAAPACPNLHVVAIPGTWETSTEADTRPGPGMLAAVTDPLPSTARVDYVTYAATAFPWEAEVYGASKREAVDNARAIIADAAQRCGNTNFAIIGYSQGADAAGDLAAEIGTGLGVVPPSRIVAVGLLSDPRRSEGDTLIGPPVIGNGAGGPRIGGFGMVTPQTRTFCAVGDLYCSTPKDDFVTRLAGFLAQNSSPLAPLTGRYTQEALTIVQDLIAAGGVPTLQAQSSDGANQDRAEKLTQFYESQVHQDYRGYVVDRNGATATSWMANWLRSLA
ncbi:cutinase family protein [Rhodococcus sp. AG1013]|uniref:cutinase family protein n=1 Tax=unclassified Rhodococcus (in: high G+C Gram-positive bacteria) TaxID=192944 RepID=UPI000E0A85FB|nr:cutinase family protein [Rhodococcus sp. AG1013]RDI30624.1 cutinase [Rhodococcus sp. AG1013]